MGRTLLPIRRARQVVGVLLLALGLCLGSCGQAAAAPPELLVRYFPSTPIYEYRWKLLQLVLEHTQASDGPFHLEPYQATGEISQSRTIIMLQTGDLDVLTFSSNAEREGKLLPVRIDILRGMLGYRIFLVRGEDRERFKDLDEATLRERVTLGFNSQWADLEILHSNGFNVVTSPGYENLFAMLSAGRFDAFPRGLNEVSRELKEQGKQYPSLAMEKYVALYMEYPVYFWVRKDNKALADRIERGLKLAMADGSYKQLFQTYFASEIAQIKREHRKVFRLHNPLLPHDTPPTDTSWWWGQ